MSRIYPVPDSFPNNNTLDNNSYETMYQHSVKDPEGFWRQHGQRLQWIKPYTKIKNVCWDKSSLQIRWFEDGQLNACANCIDRHLPKYARKPAIIWENDDGSRSVTLTYAQLLEKVCTLANVLKKLGVKKGDRVTLYMPMIPEAACAMLACSRIGAVHSVVFGGFSPEALAGRIDDCQSEYVITADQGLRGGKIVPLKDNVDAALKKTPQVKHVLVIQNTGADIHMQPNRDVWLHQQSVSSECKPEPMNAEDPLFILYTSGSTGKPKGVLHTTGGYLVWASITHQYAFDLREEDVFWCAADIGWITGHSYIVYGPLANAASSVMFEGIPTWPDASRFWQVIDKHKVNTFYAAPTALRALMREGENPVKKTSRKSLRLLATVGEPINPEAWEWYHRVVGEKRCPIVDTWWQTETGGCMIFPLPGATPLKPGSATRPFFGVKPQLLDNDGNILEGTAEGNLVIADSWPGQMRTVYRNHQRFIDTYFSTYPGKYFTGDGCKRDKDGYYWITGRVDDVINVSGHRMGTAEVESALVAHNSVAEAAVVGFPHNIKGQGIYAYVTLISDVQPSNSLHKELIQQIRTEIGAIASPDFLHFTPNLPKTRSGKIMRRILRKIANNEHDNLGDISTLADPGIVPVLIKERLNL